MKISALMNPIGYLAETINAHLNSSDVKKNIDNMKHNMKQIDRHNHYMNSANSYILEYIDCFWFDTGRLFIHDGTILEAFSIGSDRDRGTRIMRYAPIDKYKEMLSESKQVVITYTYGDQTYPEEIEYPEDTFVRDGYLFFEGEIPKAIEPKLVDKSTLSIVVQRKLNKL